MNPPPTLVATALLVCCTVACTAGLRTVGPAPTAQAGERLAVMLIEGDPTQARLYNQVAAELTRVGVDVYRDSLVSYSSQRSASETVTGGVRSVVATDGIRQQTVFSTPPTDYRVLVNGFGPYERGVLRTASFQLLDPTTGKQLRSVTYQGNGIRLEQLIAELLSKSPATD